MWVLAPVAAEAKGACVVSGKVAGAMVVTVASKDGPPVKVRVRDVPVTVKPPEVSVAGPAPGGDLTRVSVKGALSFDGTAELGHVPYQIKRYVDAANGMVRLAPGTEGLSVRARRGWAEVDLTLGGVTMRGLHVPCDALTLEDVARPELGSHGEREGERWVAAGSKLTFRHGPGRGPSMDVEVSESASAELHRLETSGAWMRVTTQWADGTSLTGWVQRSELKPAPPGHQVGEPLVAPSACAHGLAEREGARTVKAPVAPGSQVYAERLIGPWATVRATEPLTVRYRPGDEWVQLVEVPGIASAVDCESASVLETAWLQRKAVQLPAEP